MTNEELWKKIDRRISRGLSNLTPRSQLHFQVHIVEHCNLNCKWCSHFSPLAEEEYIDINCYKKDCERLSGLFDGEVDNIALLGGEPLLHPQISDIIEITREAFPVGRITIITNGLLLPAMPDDFWEVCKKCDAIIEPTYYPIKADYSGLKKLANSKNVEYVPLDFIHNTQYKYVPIHSRYAATAPSGTKNFLSCSTAECVTLKNGKIYPCTQAAFASHLKKYFNLDMHLSERDGVDIYSVNSGEELLEKLARPIPFCKYCDITDELISSDWGISRKDRYEWLAFEFTEDDMQYLKSKEPVVYVFGAGKWGTLTVNLLKEQGIVIKSVLTTRKKRGTDNILDVPIVTLDELSAVDSNSICLVALGSPIDKSQVYPILSKIDFGNVVPVFCFGVNT